MLTLLDAFRRAQHQFERQPSVWEAHGAPQAQPVTFFELAQQVHDQRRAIGQHLRSSPQQVIGILRGHGAGALASLWAVLHAGHIALPLSPHATRERLRVVCRHARPKILLCDEASGDLARDVVSRDQAIWNVNQLKPRAPVCHQGTLLKESTSTAIRLETRALLIYTSGSTQSPRGVIHTHRSLLANVRFHIEQLEIEPSDRELWLAQLPTISGITDSFRALLGGASLMPFDLGRHAISELARILPRWKPTIVHFVPTIFRRLVRHPDFRRSCFDSLRILHLGGEAVTRSDFELFRSVTPTDCRLLANYGCTEVPTSRQAILHHDATVTQERLEFSTPVPGKRIVMLDDNGDLVPFDSNTGTARGEIGIRTDLAADGYWRDADRTASQFVRTSDGMTLYRTNDLGDLSECGMLTHRGRIDRRTKLFGQFIDCIAIESTLRASDLVQECMVDVEEAAEPRLIVVCAIAGCTSFSDHEQASRKQAIANQLADLRVPLRITLWESLPVLANGKIDRSKILAAARCTAKDRDNGNRSVLPSDSSHTAQVVRQIWSGILPEPCVDNPSFVESGGDSLMAADVALQINRQLGRAITVGDVFRAGNLERLVDFVTNGDGHHVDIDFEFLQRHGPGNGANQGSPIVCVGDHRPLALIADRAGQTTPIIHLCLDGAQTPRFQGLNIEEQARRYLDELNRAAIAPLGAIVGFSYGGLLAFALACEIQRRADYRPRVVLLEPSTPGLRRRIGLRQRVFARTSVTTPPLAVDDPRTCWDECWPFYRQNIEQFRLPTCNLDVHLFANRRRLRRTLPIWQQACSNFSWQISSHRDDHFEILAPSMADRWYEVVRQVANIT